jgi:ssDNA-binding Zn-finger/Zn-ribbon topoisomerase 1
MSTDKALTVVPPQAGLGELTVQAVIDRKRKIVEVMEAVMKDGEHYGKIPGCGPKPTLFKAGAETLAMTFGLAPTFRIQQADLPGGHREYQVSCTLTHIASGAVVAEGVGCGSSMESKHRWRGGGRQCPECGKAAIIKGKAEFGGGWVCFAKKGGCGAKWNDGDDAIEGQPADRIENADPADVFNTVLKMAKKRAQVDATLTACGASDLLAQDLEDLPPGTGDADREPDPGPPPRRTLAERFAACETPPEFLAIEGEMRGAWDRLSRIDRERVTEAFHRAKARLKSRQPKESHDSSSQADPDSHHRPPS